MNNFGRATGFVAAAACAAAVGGELLYPTKARVLCRLPCYDYSPQRATPPVAAETFDAVLVETLTVPHVTPTPDGAVVEVKSLRVKVFQLAASEIRIDHCSLSNVAVTVREDGYWTVSYDAVQNPFIENGTVATPQTRYLRNKFYVVARGLAVSPLPSTESLGRPELVRITPKPHWVRRSDVELFRDEGWLTEPQRINFAALDRFSIAFRYE